MCQENATTAVKRLSDGQNREGFFVTKNVIQSSGKTNCLMKNNTPIKGFSRKGNRSGFTQRDTEKLIQSLSPISKQGGMQESEMPKVRILWTSGFLSKKDLGIGVQNAEREESLRKTILRLYPQVEQTTSETFNRFAGRAIVGNGKLSFLNIYENSELTK